MASGTDDKLSVHDKVILESIFNPNLPFDDTCNHELLTEGRQAENQNPSASALKEPLTAGSADWKRLEAEAIEAAESGDLTKALDMFNQALALEPENPSSYNNRAQCYRLMENLEGAKSDLDMAVARSGGVGAPACQALTQRAMIKRLEGDEDGCRADFKRAADLGSAFAKRQLVALNPYAALCNSMLNEMVAKLRSGQSEASRNPTA